MRRVILGVLSGLCALLAGAKAPQTTVAHPDWSRDAVIYEVNLRQYTPEGTLQAFKAHIPRLKELGVDILWFMPIHPISELNRKGGLGSYYAVRDYKDVNPEFGTLADFKEVVEAAHAAGMKVIIDWVPNHTGCDNAWVSAHPEWYAKDAEGKMFGPFDWTDVYKLDYSNREMRGAMTDALQFWLREADIDGFRCDVAGQVPVDFWNETRPALESVKKPVFMLAEATEPELVEHAFDMAYNWPMKDLFSAIAATSGQYSFVAPGDSTMRTFAPATAADIARLLREQEDTYADDSYMMNMVTNHDLNSWEGTEFERLGSMAPAFAMLSYTLPGMPLIYTGQETGLNRALEFFVKDEPPTWEPRNSYFKFYQTLNGFKHSRPELRAGNAGGKVTVWPTTCDDVLVFTRTAEGSTTLVAVNLGREEQPLNFTAGTPTGQWQTEYTHGVKGGAATELPASLHPGAFVMLMD